MVNLPAADNFSVIVLELTKNKNTNNYMVYPQSMALKNPRWISRFNRQIIALMKTSKVCILSLPLAISSNVKSFDVQLRVETTDAAALS
jgi:hypothetical protein